MDNQRAANSHYVFNVLPEDNRMTTFPIMHKGIWDYYTDAKKKFWTVEEISIRDDAFDFANKLNDNERHAVKFILAFFAASDGIVNVNLAERFKNEVPMLEAKYFYNFQIMIEDVHAHMYSLLLDTIIPNASEREKLFKAAETIPVINTMSDWMHQTISSDAPFAERLLRMACVEGIFFQGCFCFIYWLQQRGLMPGLGQSNELIAIDEGFHTIFALYLYTLIKPEYAVSPDIIRKIFDDAVNIAIEFVKATIPNPMNGMNADLMISYVKNTADNLLALIDQPALYATRHEFHFMDQINMMNRTNFFERRAAEYMKTKKTDDGSIADSF